MKNDKTTKYYCIIIILNAKTEPIITDLNSKVNIENMTFIFTYIFKYYALLYILYKIINKTF